MASNYTIAHRFANHQYNEKLQGGSTHIYNRSYYSYSTVFGQWVDLDKEVCLVYLGDTSVSSHKHQLGGSYFPSSVHVFPYDDGGSYNWWHGCEMIGEYERRDWNADERMRLIDYYVGMIYESLLAINGGKEKGLERKASRTISEYWSYIMKLCSLYRDTTIAKWLRIKRKKSKDWTLKRKLVRELDAQNMSVSSLTDLLFGEGTYEAYDKYCERFRKADKKRKQIEALCNRLGIRSPYEKWGGYSVLGHDMSADQIRKLTAKERIDIHFKAIAHKEYEEHKDERDEKYNKNFRNAYKWIVGFEPKKKSCGGYEGEVKNNCVNKDSGVVYECSGKHIFGFYWCGTDVSFNYDSFRKSEDKEQWIANFYAECKEVADNRKAIEILKRVKAHTKVKARSWDDDVYINDDYLRENTTEAEYIICSEFIRKQDKHYADEEARRRAAEIARLKREEEERREKELQERLKQEQIDECLSRGLEGFRDLWRLHYTDIYKAIEEAENESVFYQGGNVLLRFNMDKDKVETSKHIRIDLDTCKKFFKLIKAWHEDPSKFKPIEINTKYSGKYRISSYQNDILTAGCHQIAYAEMERMYNEIINA